MGEKKCGRERKRQKIIYFQAHLHNESNLLGSSHSFSLATFIEHSPAKYCRIKFLEIRHMKTNKT